MTFSTTLTHFLTPKLQKGPKWQGIGHFREFRKCQKPAVWLCFKAKFGIVLAQPWRLRECGQGSSPI
jgi:hypothetical protein